MRPSTLLWCGTAPRGEWRTNPHRVRRLATEALKSRAVERAVELVGDVRVHVETGDLIPGDGVFVVALAPAVPARPEVMHG